MTYCEAEAYYRTTINTTEQRVQSLCTDDIVTGRQAGGSHVHSAIKQVTFRRPFAITLTRDCDQMCIAEADSNLYRTLLRSFSLASLWLCWSSCPEWRFERPLPAGKDVLSMSLGPTCTLKQTLDPNTKHFMQCNESLSNFYASI